MVAPERIKRLAGPRRNKQDKQDRDGERRGAELCVCSCVCVQYREIEHRSIGDVLKAGHENVHST